MSNTHEINTAPRGVVWGLFFVALTTLSLEIMLTRIFSVTMWYHFAFLAISVAMFGMSLGAVITYVRPEWFEQNKLCQRLAAFSVAFGLSIVIALFVVLYVPFMPMGTFLGLLTIIGTYIALVIPFGASGVVISLILTRFPSTVGRLYATDLIGAAVGCLSVFVLMNIFDGPTAVLAISLFPTAAAYMFLHASPQWHSLKLERLRVASLFFVILIVVILNAFFGIIGIYWTKNALGLPIPERKEDIVYETWNPMSRITVHKAAIPFAVGWGMSERWSGAKVNLQGYSILIDNAAGTMMFKFDGNKENLEFLKDDITALAYQQMPHNARVAIIGVGGGKDVLTALLFGAKHILGIEINRDMLRIVNRKFGDFTGHLDKFPQIEFKVDEARSYIERTNEKFDIIQASLIDSWAATASGAFVLTESSLYTVEAWQTFFNHLTDDGVITFSRWWIAWQPGEMLRLVNTAVEALNRLGIKDVRNHLFVAARELVAFEGFSPVGVATLIVSRKPFSKERTNLLVQVCRSLGFKVILAPTKIIKARREFEMLTKPQSRAKITSLFPLDISPSTDNRPFFFNMLKPTDAFRHDIQSQIITQFNIDAVQAIVWLLVALFALSALLLLLPVALSSRDSVSESASKFERFLATLYFIGIGLGFMLVELGQVHRLSIYLGHPTYSLVVVLMGILLAAGAGSFISEKFGSKLITSRIKRLLGFAVFIGILAFFVWITPNILAAHHAASLSVRLAIGFVLVAIPGFFMGMPFPIGLKLAARRMNTSLAWLWAANGAFSVLGSVLALIISIGWGITTSMIIGVIAYTLIAGLLAYENKSA